MTFKEKYYSIDQTKLPEKAKVYMEEFKKDTKNFTDKEAMKIIMPTLDGFIKKLKESGYESAIKTSQTEKPTKEKVVKKKTAKEMVKEIVEEAVEQPKTTKGQPKMRTIKQGDYMRVAKEIRKEGEPWKDALKRAKEFITTQKEVKKEEAKRQYQKLKEFIQKQPEYYPKDIPTPSGGRRATTLQRDAVRVALPKGKRISKETGKAYYEYRSNRIDKRRDDYPFLAKGGEVEDYYEQLAVYVQGVGSIYNGKSMREAVKKANAYLSKKPNAEIVIVDEKYGDEYDTDGNSKEDFYANGGKIPQDKSLKYFIMNEASSGSIANKTPYSSYKDIDGIRLTAYQILLRDGDREYSLQAFTDLIKQAVEEYEENKYEMSFADGGEIVRNKSKNDWNSKLDFFFKYNYTPVGKGALIQMAYDDTKGVDSAIPQSLWGEVDNTMYYVYDYNDNKFGELVDLREKLKFSNTKVDVTIVKDGNLLYKNNLPEELKNATFHQALDYVFKNDDVTDFSIKPKGQYADGGELDINKYAGAGMFADGGSVKYPTDLKIGSVLEAIGFPMLKGIDGGSFYTIVEMDNISATLVKCDKNGNRKGTKKVRHYLDSIEGKIKTASRGDENGLLVVKYAKGGELDINKYAGAGMFARGGMFEVGDKVMVDDSGYMKFYHGFDLSEPATIISKNKSKVSGKVMYFYGLELADGKKPYNTAPESKLKKVEYAKGGYTATGEDYEYINTFGVAQNDFEEMVDAWHKTDSHDQMDRIESRLTFRRMINKYGEEKVESINKYIWDTHNAHEHSGEYAKGGKTNDIDYSKQTTADFTLGEIVWDVENKTYGTIIGIYDDYPSSKYELRLDSDGMQPTENLRKVGSKGDKGTKEQLNEAITQYARLVKQYGKDNNYPKQIKPEDSQGGSISKSTTYIPNRNIESIHAKIKDKKVTLKGKDILDGVYAKNEALNKPFDLTDAYNEIANLSYDAWDTLKIESGSEIYSSDAVQKKLADEYEKIGVDAAYMQYNAVQRRKIREMLTDENQHSLRNYFALRGYDGDKEYNDYKNLYEQYIKEKRKIFLNPANIEHQPKKKFAKGGEVSANEHFRSRGIEFLRDDLETLEQAIQDNNSEEIQKFFSYWGQHLNMLETDTNERMYNFLKDDMAQLEKAIEENNQEEIDKFFSYWNQHLENLKYAKGGQIKEQQSYTWFHNGIEHTIFVKEVLDDSVVYMLDGRLKEKSVNDFKQFLTDNNITSDYYANGGELGNTTHEKVTLIFDGKEHKYDMVFVDGVLEDVLLPYSSMNTPLFDYLEKEFDDWMENVGGDYEAMYFSDEAIYSKRGAIRGAMDIIEETISDDKGKKKVYNLDKGEVDIMSAFS